MSKSTKVFMIIIAIIFGMFIVTVLAGVINGIFKDEEQKNSNSAKSEEVHVLKKDNEETNDVKEDVKEFVKGYYVAEINSVVVMVDAEGVKLKAVGDSEVQTVLYGNYDEHFVTDGESVYLYDINEAKIVEFGIDDKITEDLTSVYADIDDSEIYQYGCITGYCDGYLYFKEEYGSGSGKFCVLDIESKIYKELETSAGYIGVFGTYGNKIYYDESRTDVRAVDLYESNADGSDEKIIAKNVANFSVIDNILYYSQSADEAYTNDTEFSIMACNLDTGETSLLDEIVGAGWVNFMDFAYGYFKNDGSGTLCLKYYNGDYKEKNRFSYFSGKDHMLFTEYQDSGDGLWYIVTENGESEAFTLPPRSTLAGYCDGEFYYCDFNDGLLKSVKLVFN